MRSSHELDRVGVIFDDDHAVASAGLVLPATLSAHLGIEALADSISATAPPVHGRAAR